MDARLNRTEESAAESAQLLREQVASLEAQICSAKSALIEQLRDLAAQTAKAAKDEAAAVLVVIRANEGTRLTELETKFRGIQDDHKTFVDRVGKEIASSRADIVAGRDWAGKRIDALADLARRLEAAKPVAGGGLSWEQWEQDKDGLMQHVGELERTQHE